jgi:hypothetical protein
MVSKRTDELIELGMTLQEIQLLNHCDTESQQTIHSWLDRRQVVIERRNQLKPVYQPLMAMAMMHNA